MQSIYLDHNATTPPLPEVQAAMAEAAGLANPASQHAAGRRARRALEDAREGIARLVGARVDSREPDRLIFTSGGTEANNLALFGLSSGQPAHAVVSAIEHPSVAGPAEELGRRGWRIDRLGVTSAGIVDVNDLDRLLTAETRLVSVMLANHETGVVQPISQITARTATKGAALHTDAVQAVGKMPVDFRALGASSMSLSAHKFHGPRGIGALVLRHGVQLAPLMFGGFQQDGSRPGTESVALAVGMHTALALYQSEAALRIRRLAELRDRFESQLRAAFPRLVVNGADAPRLPHVSNLAFRGLNRQALWMALDLAGVACSTGSACASGSSERSTTLIAMHAPSDVLDGSLRFSLGTLSTQEQIDEAVRRIAHVCHDLDRPE